MTRKQAFAAAPNTHAEYIKFISRNLFSLALVLALLLCEPSRVNRWGYLATIALFLLFSVPYFERIIRPQRAMRRSAALPETQRQQILDAATVIAWVTWASAMIAISWVCFSDRPLHNLFRFVPVPAVPLIGLCARMAAQDIVGIGLPAEDLSGEFEHSPPLTDLKPLQSDCWGG